ncbi:MAG TPA: trypsin-like peptidase domain-containing protein [Streptosporangiaceae bacterium]|nr:trypsin-like peptidase domain-containing protein [Streptosporangiaceae bacterium]
MTEGELARSVVRVLDSAGRPAGTGFLVAQQLLATCAHVVAGRDGSMPSVPVAVEFTGPPGAPGQARLGQVDPGLWRGPGQGDIAFLRLPEPPPPAASPLLLGPARGIRSHQVKTFGFAANAPGGGSYGYATAGDIIAADGRELLQLTGCTEVTEGFSGGPVLDERTGLVVGMVDSVAAPDRLGRGRATAFVTPAETLRAACAELSLSEACPYAGLRPFGPADAALFRGRDRAVVAVLRSIRASPGFVALLGPSGSGKSSLIQAGVLPALAGAALPGSDHWGALTVEPGTDPYAQLGRAGLPGVADGLDVAARRWLDAHPGHDRLVLVLDQAEELLVATPAQARAALLAQLAGSGQHDPPVTVIMVLRDDFYAPLAAAAPALMPRLERGLVNVPALLDPAELTAIITEPAARTGVALEANLAERIAGDAARVTNPAGAAAGGAAVTVLPLLSSALRELWERRTDGRLTHAAYDRMGGVIGWLDRWCDRGYAAACGTLPPGGRPLARQVLTALVRPGDEAAGIPPTRQRRPLAELAGGGTGPDAAVVPALAGQRLITTGRDPATGAPTAELAHESLIHEWALLRGWLAEDREFFTWRREAEGDYGQWQATAGGGAADPELLLRGTALQAARRWQQERPGELAAGLADFIRRSDRAERRRLSRDRRRAAILAAVTVVAVLAAALATGLFTDANRQAAHARAGERLAVQGERAARAGQLAAEATGLASTRPDVAALLSLESLHTDATQAARASVQTALSQPTEVSRVLRGPGGPLDAVAVSPGGTLLAAVTQAGQVQIWNEASGRPAGAPFPAEPTYSLTSPDVAFSPDGKLLATIGVGGGLRLWNVATHTEIGAPLTRRVPSFLGYVAFSPDGRLLAEAYEDQIRVWNVATRQPAGPAIDTRAGEIASLAFGPGGSTLVIGSDVGFVQRWAVASHHELTDVRVPESVYQLAVSPDGRELAVAGSADTGYLLDAATGRLIRQLGTGSALTTSVAFGPGGRTLAVGDSQGVIRLWDVRTGQQIGVPFLGHTGGISGLAFARRGTVLVSASGDGTVRVWPFVQRQPLGDPLVTGQQSVESVAFSPDGRSLATGGFDTTIRLWSLATRRQTAVLGTPNANVLHEVLSPAPVDGLAFSPAGGLLAAADGGASTVQLWDPGRGKLAGALRSGLQESAVAISPDGKLLAVSGPNDHVKQPAEVQVWNLATRTLDAVIRNQGAEGIAFSPDGKLLAVGTGRGVLLWDTVTRTRVAGLTLPPTSTADISVVAFSPDGTRLATAGSGIGGTPVELWDVATWKPAGTFPYSGAVNGLAFSPDGRLLASADADDSVRLWDVATRAEFGVPLDLHTAAVNAVAFSPDGALLASGSADGTARLWAAPRTWVQQACQLAGRNLTRAEWAQYVGRHVRYLRNCAQYPAGRGEPRSAPAAAYPPEP